MSNEKNAWSEIHSSIRQVMSDFPKSAASKKATELARKVTDILVTLEVSEHHARLAELRGTGKKPAARSKPARTVGKPAAKVDLFSALGTALGGTSSPAKPKITLAPRKPGAKSPEDVAAEKSMAKATKEVGGGWGEA